MRSKYFKIQELVSEAVYKKYGDKSWEFIDTRLIKVLDLLREHFNRPITVNNWLWGGNLQQRGLRANKDELVANKKDYYVSQHCLGKAVDFNVKGLSAQEVYKEIVDNKDKFYLISRIENIKDTPTWVHIDCANVDGFKIFNA
ncbi:hypothetical protein I6E17_08945 [Fusobacterium perfoetens]|uniref:D-Ala-D-Ala carboxypeptidase family metallohydrolase n=1 Tax=Fusobacterium perfoetens TaxID=852 RepID=UPI001F36C44F|nr:D-Ala-D-Ala carboxypeptidase family metallohydrolase [Fusobacterium perfoetens]MCF2626278.1 hypothetical protein [Fusobacterium perfoetens]